MVVGFMFKKNSCSAGIISFEGGRSGGTSGA